MGMKNVLFIFNLLIFSQATAQNSDLLTRYDTATIYLDGIRSFVKNGKSRPVGLFLGKIRPEFQSAPNANLIFLKARKNRITANSLLFFGYATMIGGMIHANNALSSGNPNLSGDAITGTLVMLAGACVGICATIPFRNGQKQLHQSVWVRNKEVLFK